MPFNDYLIRKWRYLVEGYDRETARGMIEGIAKTHPSVREVKWNRNDTLVLHYANGTGEGIGLGGSLYRPVVLPECEARRHTEDRRAYYQSVLEEDRLLVVSTGNGDPTYGGRMYTIRGRGSSARAVLRSIAGTLTSTANSDQKLMSLWEALGSIWYAREILENLEINDDLRAACGSAQ